MSAIQQQGPNLRKLFIKMDPARGLTSLDTEGQESRNNYVLGSKKKRPDPAPPAGLGQYRPKILSDSSEGNMPLNHGASTSLTGDAASISSYNGPQNTRSSGPDKSRPFIVGDKDTPLVLHSSQETYGLEPRVRGLRVSASSEGEGMDIGSSNPLFDLQATVNANGEVSVSGGSAAHSEKRTERTVEVNTEPDGVFVPAPDYEEDEKTMVFSEEPEDEELSSEHARKKVYKEYYGEDFSQYLSDEENGLEDMLRRQKRPGHHAPNHSRTELKRGHYKKSDKTLTGKKSEFGSRKDKTDKGFQGSGSLRNFSYADSKFGTMNGSNRRLSMHSLTEDKLEEAELFIDTGSSYEQFLRVKNGEDFVVPEAESATLPSRHARPSRKTDSLWKKLTWRFKKPPKSNFPVNTC